MEALSRMLFVTGNKERSKVFRWGHKNNDELFQSHLLFVDETLIFCEANSGYLCLLHCLFLCF
jgi:hypothetical protein